ncbi:MAG TPA: hypothetical protein VGR92_11260 [Steroidobacteraceae bacterium]|nr:hypothetical protein [Steroidobacteraceae bacterium]
MLKRRWWWRPALPSLLCALLAACLISPARVTAQEKPPLARATPLFDFHSNFWVNLQQVLFHEAKLRAGKPDRGLQSATALSAAGMSAEDETEWNAAVNFYAAHFGARQQFGPLGDDQLIEINDDLATQPDDGSQLNPAGLSPQIVAVLRSAAVIYRRYWWPAHQKSNENWIASQQERVQDLGPELAAAMTKDLHQQWPAAPIRVDVCYEVAALGHALTTLSPAHTTFSSSDPTNQGLSGFELLFHESSHTFADTMMTALAAEGRTQHKDVGDLWHSVLFYTSGVELRRVLPAPEQAGFTPYAYRYGVYRGRWRTYRPLLETHWQAYLDGKTGFTAAIHSMVAGLP